jgi:hypothetical protein
MANTDMGAISEVFARRIDELLAAEEQKKAKDKKNKTAEQIAAIEQSFREKETKKQEMYDNTLMASRMLGNPHMGGNRLSGIYRPNVSVPSLKQGPHVAFDWQSAARKVKLSDIAMAKMK